MRKYFFILIGIILTLTLFLTLLFFEVKSTPLNLKTDELPKYNIEVILKSHKGPPDFWAIVEQGIDSASSEFNVKTTVTGPDHEGDIQKQIQLVEQAILQQPDAIVLAPCDYTLLAEPCQKVRDAGIELILLDSDVDFEDRATLISTNNYEIGKSLANLVNSSLKEGEQYGIIGHIKTASTAIERYSGFSENVDTQTGEFVGVEYCDGSIIDAKNKALDMIKSNPNIKYMVGLNETSALGISYALRETNKASDIVQYSCDSSQAQIQFMENGTVEAFVVQNSFYMGYLSIESAVNILKGKKVDSIIHIDSVVVNRHNMYNLENQKLIFPFNESTSDMFDNDSYL